MSKRIPITATVFMETLGKVDAMTLVLIIIMFSRPPDKTLSAFDDALRMFRSTPDSEPGKQDAIEGFERLRSAWLKMTNGEREWLRLKLSDPTFIAKYITPESARQLKAELGGWREDE